MKRLWGLLKAWHAAALNDYMAKHGQQHQYGTGAVTTRRPT